MTMTAILLKRSVGAEVDAWLHVTVGLNSSTNESIPAYNNNISLSVKQANLYETLKTANIWRSG